MVQYVLKVEAYTALQSFQQVRKQAKALIANLYRAEFFIYSSG